MRSVFSVTVPADDPWLLTIAQARMAAGLAANDTTQDAILQTLRARVSAEIYAECKIRGDGLNPPTLRQETITETFRIKSCDDTLFLGRKFAQVTSITENGTLLVSTDTVIDGDAGMAQRISGTADINWQRGEVVVVYNAGFADVPYDLVGAAMDLARFRLSADSFDPLEKSKTIEIPGVETVKVDRWVGSLPGAVSGPVPTEISAKISRYRSVFVA